MRKRIGLVVKNDPKAQKTAFKFTKWLQDRGLEVVRKDGSGSKSAKTKYASKAPADLYCVFVLGGDGTFLSAVRWIGDQAIAVMGIKFGEVGFLAETLEAQFFNAAERILDHGFSTFPRMRLTIDIYCNGTFLKRETVLNDMVINKGALARLAQIETYIDDYHLTDFRADGLIVATPTGSTAYSLAAGGPIINPSVPAILLTPICPFTLTNRPLIVPETATIKIRLARDSSDIMLTCDGQVGIPIDQSHTITVRKSASDLHMIQLPGQNYYEILKTRLKWSGGRS